jgi:predicted O-methyltransferase YrrM
MNKVLEEIYKTNQVHLGDGDRKFPLHSSISGEEGVFLQELVRQADPKVVLEVGLAYGISALHICDALKVRTGTRHIAIDPNQYGGIWGDSWNGIGIANLRRAGFGDIVQLIEKPSHLALPELEMAGQEIDFAFIDGWHTFDFALIDFFYVDRMLRIGGIVALDDTDFPAVRKLCRFIATNRAYSVIGSCGADTRPPKRGGIAEILGNMSICRWCSRATPQPDLALNLQGRCIAFRKDNLDRRSWNHFSEF